jgi:hypothetical protein
MPGFRNSLLTFAAVLACGGGTPAQTASIPLTPYTAPDQTASAGVPAGWKVTKGGQTVIQMAGPKGEIVSLGTTIVARNAAFQPGQRAANGVDLSMPYSAPLAQKLAMVMQQSAAVSGRAVTQYALTSSTPLTLPAALGQCGRFVTSFTNPQGPMKMIAVFCSLPLDAGGLYKNIVLEAQAPAAVAAESAPAAQAIFTSYNIPAAWLQKKLAPVTVVVGSPVRPGAATAINGATMNGMIGADVSANCFSLGVLRQTPNYDLPRSCGGTKPD